MYSVPQNIDKNRMDEFRHICKNTHTEIHEVIQHPDIEHCYKVIISNQMLEWLCITMFEYGMHIGMINCGHDPEKLLFDFNKDE